MPKTAPRSVRNPALSSSRSAKRPAGRREDDILVGSPLERVWILHARLSRGEPVTVDSLAADREVSSRTIKRDIEFMRDRLGLPIGWDALARSYVYTSPCEALPMLRVDAREALALAMAGRMFAARGNSPFGRVVGGMLKKIAPVFGGAVSVSCDSVENVLFTQSSDSDHELCHFFPLLEAILAKSELRLEYTKAGSAKAGTRAVHPLHLAELDHRWVLVAHDPSCDAVRKFLLTRIRTLHPTGATFDPPKDFDAHACLRGSLGRFTGDKEQEVRIALDAHAAFYARENPWHPSQQLSERPDGCLELTLRLNSLVDAKNAVLRWGEHVEVLSPPELRGAVRDSLKIALGRYSAG